MLNAVDHHFSGLLSHFNYMSVNTGEGWHKRSGKANVIEADDGDIIRHANPRGIAICQKTKGSQIVGNNNRRRRFFPGSKRLLGDLITSLHGQITGQLIFIHNRYLIVFHHLKITFIAHHRR